VSPAVGTDGDPREEDAALHGAAVDVQLSEERLAQVQGGLLESAGVRDNLLAADADALAQPERVGSLAEDS